MRLAALCLCVIFTCTLAEAQTTFATITGTVTDASGAVGRGAAIIATNVETAVVTKTTTNDEGVYTVAQLREGPYVLSIAAPGFREFIATDVHDRGHPSDRHAPPRPAARSAARRSVDRSLVRRGRLRRSAAPPLGRFGTAERGAIESPGLNLWHFGLHKRFRFSDRPGTPSFRVEATATNIFNHPQFAAPNVNVTPTNVSAGRIRAVGGAAGAIQQAGMRAIRLGMRLDW